MKKGKEANLKSFHGDGSKSNKTTNGGRSRTGKGVEQRPFK